MLPQPGKLSPALAAGNRAKPFSCEGTRGCRRGDSMGLSARTGLHGPSEVRDAGSGPAERSRRLSASAPPGPACA